LNWRDEQLSMLIPELALGTFIAGLISIPSIKWCDLFDGLPSFTCIAFTDVCALPDIDVPEKMPKATETKNKCFIRKIWGLHVSTT